MLIDDITGLLGNRSFKTIGVNARDIRVLYLDKEDGLYTAMLLECPNGNEFTALQYNNIKRQVTQNLLQNTGKQVHFQTLIITGNVAGAADICQREEQAWIVDTRNNRLVIYENQRNDFLGIKKDLEELLFSAYEPDSSAHRNPEQEVYNRKNDGSNHISKFLSPCNTIIVILNVFVFLMIEFILPTRTGNRLFKEGALSWMEVIDNREYYRLITYMFLHSGISHLGNNMILLLFIGDNLERAVGKWKYILIYTLSGILAGGTSILYNLFKYNLIVSVGASGAIFGVVGAMAYIVAVNKGRLENISSRQIIFFAILSLYGGMTSQGVDNSAHIGGLISGVLLAVLLYRKPKPEKTHHNV
ncbi:rhomboid family intramembrane serine protease [Anaerocolumna sp. AGMB13020]|uniref:rhomboid family intramembrane serine protease n=1 Tax=Anaerocolumna sp. AGMB13020 TaxID=3081750 RepID=UPI002953EFD1|nr:rhomboid family intramembrane serine protease [Anaerocolumna sp. AGMB13020]WOO34509.1 rhomboid family intramembrane serine protease [Anaerocolumna sp. AGMB13020]